MSSVAFEPRTRRKLYLVRTLERTSRTLSGGLGLDYEGRLVYIGSKGLHLIRVRTRPYVYRHLRPQKIHSKVLRAHWSSQISRSNPRKRLHIVVFQILTPVRNYQSQIDRLLTPSRVQ